MTLLDGLRVLELSQEIAGPYCTKLLADAGADVVKIETAAGDPLRRWTASGVDPGDADGALFSFLNTSKRSVVGEVSSPQVEGLLAEADLLVESGRLSAAELARLGSRFPYLTVVSITPFGRTGPWASRPATEFTLQALCGSTAGRGTVERPPLHAGGRLGEWIGGVYAAVAAIAGLRSTRQQGAAEHVDVSLLECMAITMGGYGALTASLAGPSAQPARPPRTVEVPSIEPTADGYVGFCTVTGQQFHDFLLLIERAELQDDSELATMPGRQRRRADFLDLVWQWTTTRTTASIIELATLLRIPVAPIGTPETVASIDHFVDREVYVANPGGGFVQPRPPYLVEGVPSRPFTPAPAVGEHDGTISWAPRGGSGGSGGSGVSAGSAVAAVAAVAPLAGVRIVDFTAFWAGPSATQMLASLGADVIKIESIQRPDGMRFASARPPSVDGWWEWSSVFQGVNTNKRGVTLDLGQEEGRNLVRQLIARSDAVMENFSPRVLDHFGITWETVQRLNPRTIMVRMPAFGLSGPWRDRTGFAQTMEQASGMAWMTGFSDGPPVIPRGPCDPLAGMHAAFALLAALEERARSGRGRFIEATMVEAALNVAAELVIEQSAYGTSLSRAGNRGPVAAPQGLYACQGDEQWLALAIRTDEDWRNLCTVLGDPAWARAPEMEDVAGRRLAHDLIDKQLAVWFLDRDLHTTVEQLVSVGIPAAAVVEGARVLDNPQLRHRGFVEHIDHQLLGYHILPGVPFRLASRQGAWFERPAPRLGEHNAEVLGSLLGLSPAELERLAAGRVIGDQPGSG